VLGKSGQFSIYGHGRPRAQVRFIFENHEFRFAHGVRDRAQTVTATDGVTHANIVDARVVVVASDPIQAVVPLGQRRFDLTFHARKKLLQAKTRLHDARGRKTP